MIQNFKLPKLILLDRDGVINVNRPDSVRSIEEFEFLPGSIEALKKIQEAGINMAIITNQSVVGKGLLTVEGLDAIHAHMKAHLKKSGIELEAIFCCPDPPQAPTSRRKPAPGMLLEAMAHFKVRSQDTCMIGDDIRDMEAALRAGCHRHLVLTGHGKKTVQDPKFPELRPITVHEDLCAAAHFILG